MGKLLKETVLTVIIVCSMVGSIFCIHQIFMAARAYGAPSVAGCQDDLWWTVQATRRLLCDGPMFSDGHWNRLRIMYTPAHQVPQMTNCFGYSTFTCTTTGGYFVPYQEASHEIYPVNPSIVLPDEPGYLGDSTATVDPIQFR